MKVSRHKFSKSRMDRDMDTKGKNPNISIKKQHTNSVFSLEQTLIHIQQHLKISNKNN